MAGYYFCDTDVRKVLSHSKVKGGIHNMAQFITGGESEKEREGGRSRGD